MTADEVSQTNDEPSWLDLIMELRASRIEAIKKLEEINNSTVFVFWNLDQLRKDDFFALSDMLEQETLSKDIELVVMSPGGNGEAGYRIGHTFQQWAKRHGQEFRVIVPLYAMSAATILALGAHRLVMGLQSEIGPIDPQIKKLDQSRERWRYIPAMAIMDGLKLVSEYIDQIPNMSKFFEEIIRNERIGLDDLGELERSRESGKQYGEELLYGGMIPDRQLARQAVVRLSDYYKFHGHPIDQFEAEEQLRLKVQHCAGTEWGCVKSLRDEYSKFVGIANLIPGTIVSSVVETARARRWRFFSAERQQASTIYFPPPGAEFPREEI